MHRSQRQPPSQRSRTQRGRSKSPPDPELLRGDVTDITVVLGPHVLVSSQIEPNNKMDTLNGKIIVDSLTIGELIAIFWTQIWCMVWHFRERSLAQVLVGHWA